jgi:uncharacterized protein YcbK (DUF882 family)
MTFDERKPSSIQCSRRDILKGAAATSLFFIAKPALALEPVRPVLPVRALSFINLHTDEKLKVTYFENGKYVKGALEEVNFILRDFRNDEVKDIDVELLDKLAVLHRRLRSNAPFEIISAYRSPETNAMLHARSNGVATKSQHLLGKAVDVRLSDRDLKELRSAALKLGDGGVGYYPKSGFVHLDTGRTRSWG